jgi:peroxiredoxin
VRATREIVRSWVHRRIGFPEPNAALLIGICLAVAVGGAAAFVQLQSEPDAERPVPQGSESTNLPGPNSGPIPGPGMESVERASLPLGQVAPDFTLPEAAGSPSVRLSSFRGRTPVVLIFGSFSCNVLCAQAEPVRRLYESHKHQAQFLFVYVREAGHQVPDLEPIYSAAGLSVDEPADQVKRIELASRHYGLTMPFLLDTEDNRAERDYDAYPKRLVVIDREGRIALDAGRGLSYIWNFAAVGAWLDGDASPKRSP